jgi:hypothetical protein
MNHIPFPELGNPGGAEMTTGITEARLRTRASNMISSPFNGSTFQRFKKVNRIPAEDTTATFYSIREASSAPKSDTSRRQKSSSAHSQVICGKKHTRGLVQENPGSSYSGPSQRITEMWCSGPCAVRVWQVLILLTPWVHWAHMSVVKE